MMSGSVKKAVKVSQSAGVEEFGRWFGKRFRMLSLILYSIVLEQLYEPALEMAAPVAVSTL